MALTARARRARVSARRVAYVLVVSSVLSLTQTVHRDALTLGFFLIAPQALTSDTATLSRRRQYVDAVLAVPRAATSLAVLSHRLREVLERSVLAAARARLSSSRSAHSVAHSDCEAPARVERYEALDVDAVLSGDGWVDDDGAAHKASPIP